MKQKRVTSIWTLTALLLVFSMALPWAVFTDNVQNDVTAGGSDTFTLGGSTTVNYRITANSGDGQIGCNASDGSPATVTINAPASVTAMPGALVFAACSVNMPAVFTASAAGVYEITVSVSDSGTGTYNTNPAKFTLRVLPASDTTPPVITPSVSGTLGSNGWYVSDVMVSWTVVDDESTITSKTSCDSTTISTDTAGTTLTCSATSAGGTSSQSVTIKRDATPPTISALIDKSPAACGWFNASSGAPTVSFYCADATSGLAGACPAAFTVGEGENQSYSQTISDNAGNSASAGVSGIDVDLTAPVFGACPADGPFLLNSGPQTVGPITVDAAISGLDSGANTLNGSVDTGSVGAKTVTFTAVDNAGNSATQSCDYRVIYNWSGFFRPVDNLPVWNAVKAGSAVPVKFSLDGNQGLGIMAAGYPRSKAISCDTSAVVETVEETVTAGGSSLSYDPLVDQYLYVWKTEKAWTGCRQLIVMLNDGESHLANFKFK